MMADMIVLSRRTCPGKEVGCYHRRRYDVTWSISANIQYLFGGLVVGQCLIMCVVWMCESTALGQVVRACVSACINVAITCIDTLESHG